MEKLYALQIVVNAESNRKNLAYSHEPGKLKSVTYGVDTWIVGTDPHEGCIYKTDDRVSPFFYIEEVPFII